MKTNYIFKNLNPAGLRIGDCAIRAVAEALGTTWEKAYLGLCDYGLKMRELPNSNEVWGRFLYDHNFKWQPVNRYFSDNYTLRRFCEDHPHGVYVLATGGHVVTVKDGKYYDTWDSGDEIPIYYFYRRAE